MKNRIILFFIFLNFFATAQITGTVLNENNKPVEFATVFNLSIKTSCITDAKGVFKLKGNVGDTIRVQHVNCITGDFKINALNDGYEVKQKNIALEEVTVSAHYAFWLFEKSCKNTYNSFKDKNIFRGYLRHLSTIGKDTVQLVDVDLDIVQRKSKSFNKGLRYTPRKIQEREVSDTAAFIRGLSPIFPDVNFVNWTKFSSNYNYNKVEDSQYLKLYFSIKESITDSVANMEIIIQKSDTCLRSIALVSNRKAVSNKGNNVEGIKTLTYIEYSYTKGIGCLSNHINQIFFSNLKNGKKDMSVSLFYKTYNNGIDNIERRENGDLLFDNIIEARKIKNRYDEKFWKSSSYMNDPPYDFEDLFNFKIGGGDVLNSDNSKKPDLNKKEVKVPKYSKSKKHRYRVSFLKDKSPII